MQEPLAILSLQTAYNALAKSRSDSGVGFERHVRRITERRIMSSRCNNCGDKLMGDGSCFDCDIEWRKKQVKKSKQKNMKTINQALDEARQKKVKANNWGHFPA